MKHSNRLGVLVILIISSLLLSSCDKSVKIESKSYSNLYYSLEYPGNWQGPEIEPYTVLFSDRDYRYTFAIQALFFEVSVEDLLQEVEHKVYMIDGSKGYLISAEENDVMREMYLIHKHDTLFQLTFTSKVEDYNDYEDVIDQIVESFEFNDFKDLSYSNWNKYSTENIEVYFRDDSVLTETIESWVNSREDAFFSISEYLDVEWEYEPIKIFVFDSQKQANQYGLELGFALPNYNQIYTLYSQSKGHELAHIISSKISGQKIDSSLVSEGFSTYLDRSGRDYHKLSKDVLNNEDDELKLLGDVFWENRYGYILGASFVHYLIDEYGLELFKEFYSQNKYSEEESFVHYYNKEANSLINDWQDYLKTYSLS